MIHWVCKGLLGFLLLVVCSLFTLTFSTFVLLHMTPYCCSCPNFHINISLCSILDWSYRFGSDCYLYIYSLRVEDFRSPLFHQFTAFTGWLSETGSITVRWYVCMAGVYISGVSGVMTSVCVKKIEKYIWLLDYQVLLYIATITKRNIYVLSSS